jgi:hypothetical protein
MNPQFSNLRKNSRYAAAANPGTTPNAYYAFDATPTGSPITSVAQYLNFVEDQGYFENNTTRFNCWRRISATGRP